MPRLVRRRHIRGNRGLTRDAFAGQTLLLFNHSRMTPETPHDSQTLPLPPPPPPRRLSLGMLFEIRPAGRRWPIALSAAVSMATPVAAGWAANDIAAGLLATLGSFTAVYGSDRPYLNRAMLLVAVALTFALVVALGAVVEPFPFVAVAAIVAIASLSTFLCNALQVGPPGAYLFTLACAVGTALPVSHLAVWNIGLLVLGGGAFAFLVSMAGVLWRPRGPEQAALETAAAAVARFAEALDTRQQDETRHRAALALHDLWTRLITQQPVRPRPGGSLIRMRARAYELHHVFAQCLSGGQGQSAALAARARALVIAFAPGPEIRDTVMLPLGRLGLRAAIADSLRWGAPPLSATLRVADASAIAAAIGTVFKFGHAYWIVAAAVLMLHQGLDWARTLQRGIERMGGTLIGLVLAGIILSAVPHGLWIAAVLAALQFIIEMLVVRNYALAVVFITAAALTIAASGGNNTAAIGDLLFARGLDTVIGCLVALAVHLATASRAVVVPLPREIAATLAGVRPVLSMLASGDVVSEAARRARRNLQHRALALMTAYEMSVGASPRDRKFAEEMWPAVVAAQRVAYRVLAASWSLEAAGRDKAPTLAAAMFGADGLAAAEQSLARLATAIVTGLPPAVMADGPAFLRADLQTLSDTLIRRGR
jgi:hypothetical protein